MSSNTNNIIDNIKIEVDLENEDVNGSVNTPDIKNEDKVEYIDDFSVKNMPDNFKEEYEAFVDEIKALSTVPILKSIPKEAIKNFEYYNTRYYEDKYCVSFGNPGEGNSDINVRIHTNKLFLISLAKGNDIMKNPKVISEINFTVNKKDRSKVELRGKKKRGSKVVETDTILCQVKFEGEEKFNNIRAGVNGRIIEINELIKTNPNLIKTHPKGLGFIAIIALPRKAATYEKEVGMLNLLTEEEYAKHLQQRIASTIPSTNTA